jgi:hypothetical protein
MSHENGKTALMYQVYHMTNSKNFDCSEEHRREKALPPMVAWRAWILLSYKSVSANFLLRLHARSL